MNKDKKILAVAIIINALILFGVVMFIVADITGSLWLAYATFGFLGFMGIVCFVTRIVFQIKSASLKDKQKAKEKIENAKFMFKNMSNSELIIFFIVTFVILSSWIATIVFGILGRTLEMFISIGAFILIPLAIAGITKMLKRK